MFYWILNAPLHLFILAFKKDTELSAIYWKLKRTLNSQRYTEGWKGQWTLSDILKVEKDTELSAICRKLKRTMNFQRYIESWKGHWTLSNTLKVEYSAFSETPTFARNMSCMSISFGGLIDYCSNWRSTVGQLLQNLIRRISTKRCYCTHFEVFISSLYLSLLPNLEEKKGGGGGRDGGDGRISIFRGGLLGKRGVTFFMGLQFLHKK